VYVGGKVSTMQYECVSPICSLKGDALLRHVGEDLKALNGVLRWSHWMLILWPPRG